MKRLIHPAWALLGLLFGLTALLYLKEKHWEIVKNIPPCAAVSESTVFIVFAFAGVGAGISLLGFFVARRRKLWFPVVLAAVLLNATALSIWAYWIVSETLLPYDAWCIKVGMP